MTEAQTKRFRRQGFLFCSDCKRTIPYIAMGLEEFDAPYPQHRCGREIKPFTGWSDEDPNRTKLAGRSPLELEDQ